MRCNYLYACFIRDKRVQLIGCHQFRDVRARTTIGQTMACYQCEKSNDFLVGIETTSRYKYKFMRAVY